MEKTEKPKKPRDSLRQRRLARLIVENGGKAPLGKLMLEVGYKKGYSTHPEKLKRTLNWQQLMEKYFPDKYITDRIKKLLDKKQFVGKDGRATGELDPFAVSRGIEFALKLKDKFPAEKHKISGDIKVIEANAWKTEQ